MALTNNDRAYASFADLVEHSKDWVSDAIATTLQECTGNLVLLVRVLPLLSESNRDFVFEFLPRLLDMTKRMTRDGK
eukprot:6484517-Alexandrium_andersonii.AAC.1